MTTKPSFVTAFTEPRSPANTEYQPVYPYNNVTQTKGGHSLELDDTPTRERVRLQHGKGTFFEMHPNGDEVHKIIGDGYTLILGDHNIKIGVDDGNKAKKLNITVYGDVSMNIAGNKIENIEGSYEQVVKGDFTQTVLGYTNINSVGDMKITAGSGNLLGKMTIVTKDHLRMIGDIKIKGELIASKITSRGRIDALSGISAGAEGFVSLLGGLSIGLPAAVPLTINCAGPINSLALVSSPVASFGVMSAIFASDTVNQSLRAIHTHMAPFGETSVPITGIEVSPSGIAGNAGAAVAGPV
jgi:hypothetical protein